MTILRFTGECRQNTKFQLKDQYIQAFMEVQRKMMKEKDPMPDTAFKIRRSGLMDIDSLEEIERKCFEYGKFSRSVLTGFL